MNGTITALDIITKSDTKIKKALSDFVNKERSYKEHYLQSKYKTAFDGYSYIGQKDSLNQYDTDMLHSFVLSEFQDFKYFPEEFHSFLKEDWNDLITTIKAIEVDLISTLDIPSLNNLYEQNVMGYMMSCNYYPKPRAYESVQKNNLRLSAHKDASLFTTFPYGVDKGLSVHDTYKTSIEIEQKEKMILFPGYMAEFMTNKTIKALTHQVDLPENLDTERYSFAIFSIPKPDATFVVGGKLMKGADYYKEYLSLF